MDQMVITLKGIGDKPYEIIVPDVVSIDAKNLSAQYAEQPGLYAWYSTLWSLAIQRRDEVEYNLNIAKAKARREFLERPGDKRPTEATIDAAVALDPAVHDLTTLFMSFEQEARTAAILREAFQQRKDMLISLGANMRAEMENNIPISIKSRNF